MKIKRLEIGSFGKFKNYHLDFQEGFHVLHGNNEYGKSTIMNFIYLMFYGGAKPVRSGKRADLRKLYTSFDGEKMSGAIVFEHQGTEYRLEKVFNKSRATDAVTLWNQTTGEKEVIPKGDDIGSLFFDMGASAFEKSVFIGTIGAIEGDDDISGRLSNLITNGEETISSEKVVKNITDGKYQLLSKGKRTGAIVELREQEQSLKEERERVLLLEEEKQELEEKIQEKQGILDALKQETVFYEERERFGQKLKEYQKIDDYINKYQEFEEKSKVFTGNQISEEELKQAEVWNEAILHLKNVRDYIKDTLLPEAEQYQNILMELEETEHILQKYNSQLVRLNGDSKALEKKEEQFRDLEVKKNRLQIDTTVLESTIREYEAMAAQRIEIEKDRLKDRKSKKNQGILISAVLIGLLSVLAGILINPLGYFGLIIPFGLILGSFLKKTVKDHSGSLEEIIRQEKQKKTLKLHELEHKKKEQKAVEEDMEFLLSEIESLRQIKQEYDNIKSKIEEQLRTKNYIQEHGNKIKSLLEIKKCRLLEIAEDFLAEGSMIDFLKKKESELLETERSLQTLFQEKECNNMEELKILFKKAQELENEKKGLDQLKAAYGLEKDSFEEIVRKQKQAEEDMEGYEKTLETEPGEEELKRQEENFLKNKSGIEQISKSIEEFIHKKIELSAKAGDLNELDERLAEVRGKLSEMETFYEILDLAQTGLEEAENELRNTFGPMVNDKTAQIFYQLTGGRYGDVRISKNFAVSALPEGEILSYDSEYLSSGTLDQAYLSLRLAITELLTKEDSKLPVLLDDVLMQYDDRRTEIALKFLSNYAGGKEGRQILLFTCHGTIAKWCKEHPEHVRYVELG